ncbi:MAG: GC-type dockerin domain-anchored protein [Planctomycetota bacterium]
MQTRQVRGIAALVGTAGLSVGVAGAQPLVIDWLAPTTGLWSNAGSWSGGNVPDTLDEIARLSPERLGRGLLASALVDQGFSVEAVTGTGTVDLVIQNDASLAIGSLFEGTSTFRPLRVFVGDDSLVGGGALLELIGTGDPRNGRANLRNVVIDLVNETAELVSNEETRIGTDAIVVGAGRVIGSYANSGTITSRRNATLTIQDASIHGGGELVAETFSQLRIEQSDVTGGRIAAFGGSVRLDGVDLSFTELTGFTNPMNVEGASTFTDVVIDSGVDLRIGDPLRYVATDGVFKNTGDVLVERPGRLEFDDTPDNAVLIEAGRVQLRSGWITAQQDDEVYLFPGAAVFGSGGVLADVVNLGDLDARDPDPEFPRSTLQIGGSFTQLSVGRVTTSVAQRLLPSPGDVETQSVVVDGNAALGGELAIDYLVLEPERIAGIPITVLLVRGSSSAVIGEFDRVSVGGVTSGLSPIPQVDYLDQSVDVTLFCLADVNRDGSVNPADFTAWVRSFNDRDPLADQNLDGGIDPSDFNAWVTNFNSGCGR